VLSDQGDTQKKRKIKAARRLKGLVSSKSSRQCLLIPSSARELRRSALCRGQALLLKGLVPDSKRKKKSLSSTAVFLLGNLSLRKGRGRKSLISWCPKELILISNDSLEGVAFDTSSVLSRCPLQHEGKKSTPASPLDTTSKLGHLGRDGRAP